MILNVLIANTDSEARRKTKFLNILTCNGNQTQVLSVPILPVEIFAYLQICLYTWIFNAR